jgi:hypothetical protein
VTNHVPYILIDDPPTFGPLESLEKYLADVKAMPNFVLKAFTIEQAEWYIAQVKQSMGAAQLSFHFLDDTAASHQEPRKIDRFSATPFCPLVGRKRRPRGFQVSPATWGPGSALGDLDPCSNFAILRPCCQSSMSWPSTIFCARFFAASSSLQSKSTAFMK